MKFVTEIDKKLESGDGLVGAVLSAAEMIRAGFRLVPDSRQSSNGAVYFMWMMGDMPLATVKSGTKHEILGALDVPRGSPPDDVYLSSITHHSTGGAAYVHERRRSRERT